ncbi:MAG: type 2 isopentenyl-diphosphate Delta-isomerase [Candidatus Diapherotrites archaeon]|nr:type 2 isopentenyl-diphosphate Delta-isomerase [Candidatus Diapherotrites archaeon]
MIKKRKLDHIEICTEKDVEVGSNWFEYVQLIHNAVPEINLDDVETKTTFLGKELKAPLMVAAITGGVEEAKEINKSLAKVCEEFGIAFGLGSQRAMIEHPELWDTYYVRDVAPNIPIFGNIGLANLGDIGINEIIKSIKRVDADFLCVHLNAAQEAAQPEGNTQFAEKIKELAKLSKKIPIIAKEVGNGISRETAILLKEAGVKAIDVGGFGGTSWIKVEEYRSKNSSGFVNWGIPTAAAVMECSAVGLPIIATGGIRRGLECAKAIALGASICGMALPCLRWHYKGKLRENMSNVIKELKTAMFLTGSRSIGELKQTNAVISGKLKEWCEARSIPIKHYAMRRSHLKMF